MSRKYYGSHTWTEICAFWAIVISGFAYLFGGVVKFLISVIQSLKASNTAAILNSIYNVITFLGNIALIVAVAIPAWQYVKGRSRAWKAVYWIALIGFALGAVLGLLGSLNVFVW